jgi:hypothetical protein
VWSRGKAGDNFKCLPIANFSEIRRASFFMKRAIFLNKERVNRSTVCIRLLMLAQLELLRAG